MQAECKRNGPTGQLVLRNARIYLVAPRKDAAFHVAHSLETGLFQKLDGFRAASAALAIGSNFNWPDSVRSTAWATPQEESASKLESGRSGIRGVRAHRSARTDRAGQSSLLVRAHRYRPRLPRARQVAPERQFAENRIYVRFSILFSL